jgi:hypothetical protein
MTSGSPAQILWTVGVLVLLIVVHHANAQSEGNWVNPTLSQRGIAGEQFQIIGKGHLAECRAKGMQTARQTIPPTSLPEGFMSGIDTADRDMAREAVARDIFNGCMAEKGWIFQRR